MCFELTKAEAYEIVIMDIYCYIQQTYAQLYTYMYLQHTCEYMHIYTHTHLKSLSTRLNRACSLGRAPRPKIGSRYTHLLWIWFRLWRCSSRSASRASHRDALSTNPEKYGESFRDWRRHWLSPTWEGGREGGRERGGREGERREGERREGGRSLFVYMPTA